MYTNVNRETCSYVIIASVWSDVALFAGKITTVCVVNTMSIATKNTGEFYILTES
jgi:hypothetical protein